MTQVHVAIIDSDDPDRARLENLFARDPGFHPEESFASAEQALQRACEPGAPRWDLILMDLRLAGASDVQAIRHLRSLRPETQIVARLDTEHAGTILEAIRAGANGYLLKPAGVQEVLEGVHIVMSGGSPMTPAVARAVLDLAPVGVAGAVRPETGAHAPPRLELSGREREVLQHLAAGLSAAQVAATLEIGVNGVRSHVRHVYRRLQILSVAQAVLRALRGEGP